MNIQAKLVAGLFLILAVLASYFATYRYGRHVEFITQQNIQHKLIEAATKKNDDLKLVLQLEKTNAENALNILLDRPANRVQVPACISQANPASGVEQTIEANRLLSEETGRILSEDRQRARDIVGEAEQELIECRVSKNWAGSLR